MDEADNPYTALEGYDVYDARGEVVGEIEDTVYDAPSDVLKYVIVDRRPIPAEIIDVDPDARRVSVACDRETVETAPEMEDPSGTFDRAVREHYGMET